MKFDELDARMRVYETSHDHCVLIATGCFATMGCLERRPPVACPG